MRNCSPMRVIAAFGLAALAAAGAHAQMDMEHHHHGAMAQVDWKFHY